MLPLAEEQRITVCVELLNSKVNHPDYMGDHTAFGVQVIQGVGSPAVKLLYDIYHMQIMEGDVIRTIRDNLPYIAHFHTGGVPGRHELDDSQELNWRTIARAIADLGFTGYIAHENGERGTGNGEQGTGNREQGTGNRAQSGRPIVNHRSAIVNQQSSIVNQPGALTLTSVRRGRGRLDPAPAWRLLRPGLLGDGARVEAGPP